MTTTELVLAVLEKGMMIHGGLGAVEDPRYPEPVYSVMISANSKRSIVVYAVGVDACQETALRYALENALERANSKVKPLKG